MFCSKLYLASAAVKRLLSRELLRVTPAKSQVLTAHYGTRSQAAPDTALTKDDRRDFMALFPDLVRDLAEIGKYYSIPEIKIWFPKVLQYNVAGGKRLRGLTASYSFRMFASPEDITPDNIRLSMILGWCLEMLQGFFLILDDVMDESETRRGRPCWYKVPDVGLRAINDALIIESGIHFLLKKHFSSKPYYLRLIELFHDVRLKTEVGQALDFMTAKADGHPRLDSFTMDKYNNIVKYKTAYYSFHLPVAAAMHMAGITDPEKFRQAKNILLEMGHFFQVQDDYIDVFGDSELTGKVGTDIQEGKCTWLSVMAVQRASPDQRQILIDHFGQPGAEHVQAVKDLYVKLGLPQLYTAYEEECYNMITTMIQQISRGMPHELFFTLLEKLYKRKN